MHPCQINQASTILWSILYVILSETLVMYEYEKSENDVLAKNSSMFSSIINSFQIMIVVGVLKTRWSNNE